MCLGTGLSPHGPSLIRTATPHLLPCYPHRKRRSRASSCEAWPGRRAQRGPGTPHVATLDIHRGWKQTDASGRTVTNSLPEKRTPALSPAVCVRGPTQRSPEHEQSVRTAMLQHRRPGWSLSNRLRRHIEERGPVADIKHASKMIGCRFLS